MPMTNRKTLILLALPVWVGTAAGAQQRPPVRQIGAVSAKSSESYPTVVGVRALPDGRVLVNDVGARRVLLYDASLSTFTIVADSTSDTGNAYGGRVGNLIAYRGDSSVFIDPSSVSMLVIDGSGKVARVMAIPRAEDAGAIGSPTGNATIDRNGRLIYRAQPGFSFGGGGRMQIQGTPGAARTGPPPMPDIPDSAFIVSVNLATRKLDTLGYIRTPKVKMEVKQLEGGGFNMQSMLNPLPVVDDWAVLNDGTIALVRGRDYHVEYVTPDGASRSAAKIPFDWQRMTEEDKVAFIDSVKAARARLGANAPVPVAGQAPGHTAPGAAAPGAGAPGAGAPQVMVFSQTLGSSGGGPPPSGSQQVRLGGGPGGVDISYVPASELPDYKPPFFSGSTRADTEGNLWIRTIPTAPMSGGPVYDVINKEGAIVERVQIPENRTIVGFGQGGVVYMINRDGTKQTLEKASIR